MDQPVPLASPWISKETLSMSRESVSPETKVHTVPIHSAVLVPDTAATGTTPTDVCRGWKSVSAIVIMNHVKDMLDQGDIQHSRSPWNSPLFLVPKRTEALDLPSIFGKSVK